MRKWPVKVGKAAWERLSRMLKEAKRRGEQGAELRAVVTVWEGANVPLRWGLCPKCEAVSPTRKVRVRKCLLCGARVESLVGDSLEAEVSDDTAVLAKIYPPPEDAAQDKEAP